MLFNSNIQAAARLTNVTLPTRERSAIHRFLFTGHKLEAMFHIVLLAFTTFLRAKVLLQGRTTTAKFVAYSKKRQLCVERPLSSSDVKICENTE